MGLTADAPKRDVEKRFRELALEHHPDKFAAAPRRERERAQKLFQRLQREREDRLEGRPPSFATPEDEELQLWAVARLVALKLATIVGPLAGLAAYMSLK